MARPLLKVHCIEKDYCEYPVAVKIAMDDGTVQTYTLDCKADYQFDKVMKSLEKLTVGYQYKPETRKRRLHRGKL